ncbi:IAP2 [Orgyia pseudotsugata single capsid nuclopolyhedrovirus]|nr:IAP2 [Orgyia pseudotsugata single capsid nuclopolyhedrovirus]
MNYAGVLAQDLPPPFNYKSLQTRVESLHCVDALMSDEKRSLANHGVYYDAKKNMYRCAYCSTSMRKYSTRELKYHKFSARCPRSTELLRTNRALRKFSFTSFKVARNRYENRRDELADDGFFFDAQHSNLRCSDCGMVIECLNKEDGVHMVHKLYSPLCAFVKAKSIAIHQQEKSHAPLPSPMAMTFNTNRCVASKKNKIVRFADDNVNGSGEHIPSAPILIDDDDNNDNKNNYYNIFEPLRGRLAQNFDVPANVNAVKNCSTSEQSLAADMQSLRITDAAHKMYPALDKMTNDVVSVDANYNDNNNNGCDDAVVKEKPRQEQHARILEDRMCKICFEHEKQICFLPCGHVSTCEQCARRCAKCCMCRKPVKTMIKVFI